MPRYLLPFVVCVAILSGRAAPPDSLPTPPVYGQKALQGLRTYYGKPLAAGESDATDSARRDYKADYRALVVAATYRDRRALATLMSFSMDGEAGEEHVNTLAVLLGGLGDDFYSSVLKSQPPAVRKLVLEIADYCPELTAHSPKTFRITADK